MAVETPSAPDPSSTAPSFGGASRMATPDTGDQPPDATGQMPGATNDPQQALSGAVQVIRAAEQSLVDLSKQFPQAAAEVRNARNAIRSILKKIVSSPGAA